MDRSALERFTVVALTHKNLPLELIGRFHIDDENIQERLRSFKSALDLEEFMYLSTCNRVEFVMVQKSEDVSVITTQRILQATGMDLTPGEITLCTDAAEVHTSDDAVKHLFKVSSSLDSMVIGEREIITQVRNAFETCRKLGLTGDFIRIVFKKTIETAKRIFTETDIFRKPVSVVSLAFHSLRDLGIDAEKARVIMIGAGKTNRTMARFLSKHGFKNIAVFNRSVSRAQQLASEIKGQAFSLDQLPDYNKGFDVLIACTGASLPVITSNLYKKLLGEDQGKKVLIDLAIPADIERAVVDNFLVKHIDIEELRKTAETNLKERQKEVVRCEEIIGEALIEFHDLHKTRRIELAMSQIPQKVKEIHHTALSSVFAKELEKMDGESREVLDKVMAYLEKKYISMPMKMAREVMLKQK